MEHPSDALRHQIVVQGEHGGPSIDTNDVTAHPVAVQVHVAEAVASTGAKVDVPVGCRQSIQDFIRSVRDGGQCGVEVGGSVY